MLDPKNKSAAQEDSASDVFGDQAKTATQNDQPNNTPVPAPSATAKDEKAKRSRSTATKAQIAKLLVLLREHPQTTHYLRTHGISHPAGRVNDLRKSGCEILTQRVGTTDSDGFAHINVARYVLLKEPPRQLSLDVQGGK